MGRLHNLGVSDTGTLWVISDTDSKTLRKFVSGSNHDNLIGALLQIPDRRECDGAASRG